MRVLLIGATGFLGAAIRAALVGQGHAVSATYHRGAGPISEKGKQWGRGGQGHAVSATYHRGAVPISEKGTQWWRCDLAQMSEADWREPLQSIDVVINCAGILQDNAWESTGQVHVAGVQALVAASEKARLF